MHTDVQRIGGKGMQNKINASSVEQVLACIYCQNNTVFELCGGLVDDWQKKVHDLTKENPNAKCTMEQLQDPGC